MDAGYAQREITPPVGIRLGGYAHRLGKSSQVVHDPLVARAVLLRADDEVMLLSADVLGIEREFADGVKRKIQRRTGMNSRAIFLTTTHTHSGPETIIPMWPNVFPYSKVERSLLGKWLAAFREQIVDAASEACSKASRAAVVTTTSHVPTLTYNRSFREGPIDPDVPVLFLRSSEKIMLSNFACHPVCNSDLGISADYPGKVSSKFTEHGIRSVFTLGPAGDIDPLAKDRAFISNMGNVLWRSVNGQLRKSVERLPSRHLKVESRRVRLDLRRGPAYRAAKLGFRKSLSACRRTLLRPVPSGGSPSMSRYEDCLTRLLYADEEYELAKDKRTQRDSLMKAFTIDGTVAFLTIPGEFFVELGLTIKEAAMRMGYGTVIIATCSDDYVGYIPARRAFELKTYEARLARWSRITPEAADLVVKEAIGLLGSLRGNDCYERA